MQTTVISLTFRLKICLASLWSSLGVRLKVETIGGWEIKGEHFKPQITNREQNHRTTAQQWTFRQDGKTDVPDETHARRLCRGKQTQEQNHTEMSWEQLLGRRDPMEIIKMRTHEIITTKESYPHNSYTGLAGLAWMCHLDDSQDGIITAMHWWWRPWLVD